MLSIKDKSKAIVVIFRPSSLSKHKAAYDLAKGLCNTLAQQLKHLA